MNCILVKSERLMITELCMDMAKALHQNSLDDDNRQFVPDEVFETVEEAESTIALLLTSYETKKSPLVYAILLQEGENIGYVQAVTIPEGWEIGYHIAKAHTGRGYAKEAVTAFLPVIMDQLQISQLYGVCLKANIASSKVLQHCGFQLIFDGIGKYQGKDQALCRYVYHTEN